MVQPVLASASPPAPVTDAEISRQAAVALEQGASPASPGAAILVARGDTVLIRRAVGSANIEFGVPLSADQTFRIASVTKIFTAAMVLKLVQDGKLALDDPLANTLPDFPNARSITVRQLLSHTAGLSDRRLFANDQPGFLRSDIALTSLVAEIAKEPLRFAPGSRQAYANAGYILLGAVIERVTGKSWNEAMREQLLDPLGLTRTSYGRAGDIIPGRVSGYTRGSDGGVANADFISVTVPASAGALVSTVDDLHRWMRALTSGRAIGPAGFALMSTPATVPGGPSPRPYGLGLYVWRVRGEPVVGHTGQINGFATFLAHIPSRDVTIVVLSNDDGFDAQTMGRRLSAMAMGQPYTAVEAVPISEAEKRSLAGDYRDGQTTVSLTVRDGNLYYQRDGGTANLLRMSRNQQLHFTPDELSYFVPVRNSRGSVIKLDYWLRGEGPPTALLRLP